MFCVKNQPNGENLPNPVTLSSNTKQVEYVSRRKKDKIGLASRVT
jgi:hypothetical protein